MSLYMLIDNCSAFLSDLVFVSDEEEEEEKNRGWHRGVFGLGAARIQKSAPIG